NSIEVARGEALALNNPSFEYDTGWGTTSNPDTLPANVEYTADDAHTGGRALRLYSVAGGGVTVNNSAKLYIQKGDVVDVSFWCGSIGSVPNGYIRLSVWWRAA